MAMAKPPGAGGSAALDAMHQLLHIKLKWRLTERELEHIERVFAMFDGRSNLFSSTHELICHDNKK